MRGDKKRAFMTGKVGIEFNPAKLVLRAYYIRQTNHDPIAIAK
jgi:hypothetical protein